MLLLESGKIRDDINAETYERSRSAVKRMPVVSPELGVGAAQRRVSVRLGALDAVAQDQSWTSTHVLCQYTTRCRRYGNRVGRSLKKGDEPVFVVFLVLVMLRGVL